MLDGLCAEVERSKQEIILKELSHSREIEKYTSEVERLKIEIVNKETLSASNTKELEARRFELQEEAEKLHLRIKEFKDEQLLLLNDMTELKDLVQDLQDRRTNAEAEVNSLKHQLNSQKAQFDDNMTGLFEKFVQTFPVQSTIHTFEEAFTSVAATIAGFHEKIEDLRLQCTEYEHRISGLDVEIATVTFFVNF